MRVEVGLVQNTQGICGPNKMKTNNRIIIVLSIILIMTVLLMLLPNLIGISTSSDLDKCKSIVDKGKQILSHDSSIDVDIMKMVMYCTPGVEGVLYDSLPVVSIYGYVNKEDHIKIMNRLQSLEEGPFKIIFYEKENIMVSTDSKGKVTGTKRGPEKEISKYEIKK